MKLRAFDYDQDLETVIGLFQNGLSRTGDRAWFDWKHRDNPFGRSPGYVAELEGRIVAARFFLRWRFRDRDRVVSAIRPVDTVVHPSARRRGIFTKLTLYGLEQIPEEQRELVFNTPNRNSLPGYLKMGWEVQGPPLAYSYRPMLPLLLTNQVHVHDTLPSGPTPHPRFAARLATDADTAFISWRYSRPPYRFATYADARPALLVYRMLHMKGLPVLSVSDYVGEPDLQHALVKGAAAREHSPLIHCLADDTAWPAGNQGLRLRRGESLVAIRGTTELLQQAYRFSPGDLEDIL